MAEPPPPPPALDSADEPSRVIVRPYPKIVFFYLTWLVSLACGILQPDSPGGVDAATSATLGRIWLAIFTFNILVIAFEFSRVRSVAIAFFVIAFVFAGIHYGFLRILGDFFGDLDLRMNKIFYYSVAAVFSIIYLLVFIATRFNYWEIQPNEILHHQGFMGDVHRYPTPGLKMTKEISDLLEYLLLRSGRLVLDPRETERPIVLENVIGLNRVEDKIQRLLGTMKVRLDRGRIGGED
ncbi:MAG: hypothetical protein ACT4PV_11050 [Planctomycetaceae bacterium]